MNGQLAMNTAIATDGNDNKKAIIGYYSLGETIGEGTFGKVVLGTHLVTGEKVL